MTSSVVQGVGLLLLQIHALGGFLDHRSVVLLGDHQSFAAMRGTREAQEKRLLYTQVLEKQCALRKSHMGGDVKEAGSNQELGHREDKNP